MPDTDFSAFGLSMAEVNDIDHALKSYSQRFNRDERDDAVADGWCAVLTFPYETPPKNWPAGRPRTEQVHYLRRVACKAAAKFVNRHAYDAPLDHNGNAQTRRMTDHIPE